MSYRLGIDLGATFTAAAVCEVDTSVANPEVIPLGARTASVPSVVFVAEDGTFVFGDSAGRRCVTDPERVIREFKRRIGDPIPIVVNGSLYQPHVVAAGFVRWVVEQVTERKGSPPDSITVTHPAAWGEYKCSLFVDALAAAGLDDVELTTEPEAAAIAYATDLRVDPGSTVAVYDLGGGTFDAAVVHGRDRGRFDLVGAPAGLEALGGAEFDETIFEAVRSQLTDSWDQLDVTEPSVLSAIAALRRECTEAKEALSSDTEVTIPVMLPGVHSQLRLTRGEFEEMISPAVGETLEALQQSLSSAGVTAEDISAVLLVGGSSRIPVIAQRLSERFDRPIVADTDPKSTVALGAALSGLAERAASGGVGATRVDLAPVQPPGVATGHAAAGDGKAPATTQRRRRALVLTAVVALVLFGSIGTLASDPFGWSRPDGAPAAGGLPRAEAAQAAGPRAEGGEPSSAAQRSEGAPAGARIDPWTGRPVEKDGTTTPGPKRAGATPADAGSSSGSSSGRSSAAGSSGGSSEFSVVDPSAPTDGNGGSSGEDGVSPDGDQQGDQQQGNNEQSGDQQDKDGDGTDTPQQSDTPSNGSDPPSGDSPTNDPSRTPRNEPPSETTPSSSPPSDEKSSSPQPTPQDPVASETDSGSQNETPQKTSSSQPPSSPSPDTATTSSSGAAG